MSTDDLDVYPPFSGFESGCPKCGVTFPGFTWRPPTRRTPQYLLRTCCCGYAWREQCVDD